MKATFTLRLKTELKDNFSGNPAIAENLFHLPFQNHGLCLGRGILQPWQNSFYLPSSPLIAELLVSVINSAAPRPEFPLPV